MDINLLQKPDVQQFIKANENTDPTRLILQSARYPDLPMKDVAEQVRARQKSRKKLPEWNGAPGIIFPVNLSMEQCSSEATAKFKSTLVSEGTMADITGGFGVDCYYLSRNFGKAYYVEQNQELVTLAEHNFNLLGAKNIAPQHKTAQQFLADLKEKLHLIYLDPARRNEQKQKVFRLQDCEPNVLEVLPALLQKSEKIMLKTAPVMDIDLAVSELKKVEKVWVVTYAGECREVLYLLSESGNMNPEIHAVDLQQNHVTTFSFTREKEQHTEAEYSLPLEFIYEPNPSVMKAGAFKSIGEAYKVKKLHQNSHLYTSSDKKPDFPGRIFRLLSVARLNKKELQQLVPGGQANITTRNFPEPVEVIRKKTGLKDGGETYILATTNLHQKPVLLICEKA